MLILTIGVSKWDDILTQVLATSQKEYLDSLKKQHISKEETDKKYLYDTEKPSTSQ